MDKQELGSQTAKGGFANEKDVVAKFNNWQNDTEAKEWLKIMGYNSPKIQSLIAIQVPTRIKAENAEKYNTTKEEYKEFAKYKKADMQIKLVIVINNITKIENISLKKANENAGFNQIDKRKVEDYKEMWKFDDEIALWLKLFTGEFLAKDYKEKFEDYEKIEFKEPDKRIFANEMPLNIQEKIVTFFEENKSLILDDTLRGRGGLSANWMLVTQKNENNTTSWTLKTMNETTNFYGQGETKISPRGSFQIGKITLQRKGGTPDPTKLQFKFNPCELFNLI